MGTPNIVITSTLGDVEREETLAFNIEQRKILKDLFPGMEIVSICSGFGKKEQKAMKGFECIFLEGRVHKYQKHRRILKKFYKSKKLKSLLLLDHDAIPMEVEEHDIDTVKQLNEWLSKPKTVPAPCLFFSAHGLIGDTYTERRKENLKMCGPSPVGWAIMVTSDLGVMPTKKTMLVPGVDKGYCDDIAFRFQCAAEGKLVLKCELMFFRSLQKIKSSTLSSSDEERREGMKLYRHYMTELYPSIVEMDSRGYLRPIWRRKKRDLEDLVKRGAMERTDYGYVPIPGEIEKVSDAKKQAKGFGIRT